MQTANTTKGIVQKSAGVPRQSTFNNDMVVSITVKNNDGTTLNIWGKAGSTIEMYKVNDPIEYCKSGKEYVFFHTPTHQNDTAKTPHPSVQTPHTPKKWEQPDIITKQSILDYCKFESKLYLHIFKSVSDDFSDMGLKDAELKDISTTIFIQTQRRFSF